jgi:membrane protein
VLGVAGWLTNDPSVRMAVAEVLANAFPPLADLIDESLAAMSQGAAATSILGVVGLIWTVSQLYAALDVAFARIYSIDPERDVVRRTARGLLVVAILVVAIVGLIVLATVGSALEAVHPADLPVIGSLSRALGSVPVLIALAIGLVLVVYRTTPPRAPAWRSAFAPAVVVGVIIVLLSQVFTFLVPRLVGVAALAGSLASAFVALAWLSFTFQALLYGAAWVRVRDQDERPAGSGGLVGPAATAELGGGGQ